MKKLCVVSLNELNVGSNGTDNSNKIRIQPNNQAAKNDVDLNSSLGDSDDLASDTETVSSNGDSCQKRKRQRLTHLSAEEKMMRRKLKNRVAAQSARDRKKVKMDDLELDRDQVKAQNDKLKKENAILKEKVQLLIDENRKLLKFKSDTESKQSLFLQKPIVLQPVLLKQQPDATTTTLSLASKSNSPKAFFEADESAVFTKYASQPKRQLQGMFQRIIYMLILQTLSLIRGELSNSTGNVVTSQVKVAKLRSTLARLYQMASGRRQVPVVMLPKAEKSIQIMNTYKKKMNSVNLALLVSMIVQHLDMNNSNKKKQL